MATQEKGDIVQQVVSLFGQNPPNGVVLSFIPEPRTDKAVVQAIIDILALKGVPARLVRGIRLEKGKKTLNLDVMFEAYLDGMWKIYNPQTGKKGLPITVSVFNFILAVLILIGLTEGVDALSIICLIGFIASAVLIIVDVARNKTLLNKQNVQTPNIENQESVKEEENK